MNSRRKFLSSVIASSGIVLSGCLSSGTEQSTQPTPGRGSDSSETIGETYTDNTPSEFKSCPSSAVQAAGKPLTITERPTDPTHPASTTATVSGTPTEQFLKEWCRDVYESTVSERVETRFESGISVAVDLDIAYNEGTPIRLALVTWVTKDDEIYEVPPVSFEQFRDVAPKSLTAPVVVNNTEYTVTVPIVVRCQYRQVGPD